MEDILRELRPCFVPQSLLIRAEHVNHSVLELPRDVEDKLLLVNSSVADFMKLYSGEDSLLNLPQQIQEAGAKLAMPDSSKFIAELKAAEAQLNDATGLPELITKLTTLARALDKTLRDAKSNIQPSLDAFAADDSVRMDLADTLTFEAPVVAGAASLFESANLGGFKEYVKAVLTRLDAAVEPARRQADAIPGVLKQIADFDVINRFMAPLQQAEAVYKQFNGNPAEVRVVAAAAAAHCHPRVQLPGYRIEGHPMNLLALNVMGASRSSFLVSGCFL
jgi:hypothetical protein